MSNRPITSLMVAVCVLTALISSAALALSVETEKEKSARILKEKQEAPPVLVVTPISIRKTFARNRTHPLELTVANGGGSKLNWTIGSVPNWIALPVRRSGELNYAEKSSIVLRIDPGNLPRGNTSTEIKIEAPGAKGSPASVRLTVIVPQAKPKPSPPTPKPPIKPKVIERPTPPRPKPTPPKLSPRDRVFGARAGVMRPASGDRVDFDTVTAFGVFWRPNLGNEKFGMELGMAYGQTESDSGLEETSLIRGHFDGLWNWVRRDNFGLYGLGSVAVYSESVDDEELSSTSQMGSSITIGVGAMLRNQVDIRIGYELLLGSDNIGNGVAASVGFLF